MSITRTRQRSDSVRTTVTLDADVRLRAAQYSASRGISFREGLNELVRIGLTSKGQQPTAQPFTIQPLNFGLKPGLSYDNIEDLIEFAEGPLHR